MKQSRTNGSSLCRMGRSPRGFACPAGMSLVLFLAACASAHPAMRLSSASHFLPAVKAAWRVPLPNPLRDSAKNVARLLYISATGSTPTDSELTLNVNLAAAELAAQLAPSVPTSDALYYDLFGDLGMFTHLVEQTVLLTALQHHRSITPPVLLSSLQKILSDAASATDYNKVAILTGRPLLPVKSRPGQTPPREPRYPHGPIDPNQMVGPIFLSDRVPELRPTTLISYTSPVTSAFYTQPFVYTIRFANLRAAGVGDATVITIKDTLDSSQLDPATLRLGLITVENGATGTVPMLRQLTPPPAAIGSSAVKTFSFGGVNVTFTRADTHLQWKIMCALAPGSEGSVSFLVSPRNARQPIPETTIHNDGAEITFEGGGFSDTKNTNPWLAVP